jgi:hypothetical protein
MDGRLGWRSSLPSEFSELVARNSSLPCTGHSRIHVVSLASCIAGGFCAIGYWTKTCPLTHLTRRLLTGPGSKPCCCTCKLDVLYLLAVFLAWFSSSLCLPCRCADRSHRQTRHDGQTAPENVSDRVHDGKTIIAATSKTSRPLPIVCIHIASRYRVVL